MCKTPQICIVTEGGGTIGFGHLSRCQSICQAFAEVDVQPTLLVDGDKAALEFCGDQSVRLIPWHRDWDRLWNDIRESDMVIIDSLKGSEAFFAKVQREVKMPVFIDDYLRRGYDRGVVVDWTVLAEKKFYKERHPQVTYLLGSRYTALRSEFWDTKIRPVAPNIRNVLVTFGGSDAADMTPRVLKLLSRHFPNFNAQVVIGPGYRNSNEISKAMKPEYRIFHCPTAEQMRGLMYQADIAIATGGQTLYELAGMGLPTIAVMVADNQRDDISGWTETEFVQYAGLPHDDEIEDRIVAFIRQLEDYNMRSKCSRLGRQYIDGNGARRVITVLKEIL